METESKIKPAGRFAPSPTGRMHLGNIYTAVISWAAARACGLEWILRIEDIDRQRSRPEFASLIEDDLHWLGVHWDRKYVQSERFSVYQQYFDRLKEKGLLYPCTCRRADIMAGGAPHQSDGHVVYSGHCRPSHLPWHGTAPEEPHSWRIITDNREISFIDGIFGPQSFRLDAEVGDFIVKRSDGSWAYQLAVAVDDALMGVSQVVRGADLLLSAAQQNYIRSLLDLPNPDYIHLPLLCAPDGRRLSKRDESMAMDYLRSTSTPEQLIGRIAHAAHLTDTAEPLHLAALPALWLNRLGINPNSSL